MSRDADVLNRFSARLRAAAAAYRRAGADGPGLSDVFAGAADAHDRTAEGLDAVLRAVGGAPVPDADPGRHAWADLPRAAAEGPQAIADAVRRAEGELLAEFRAALDDEGGDGSVRDAVSRACDAVKAGRDRALRRLDALGG